MVGTFRPNGHQQYITSRRLYDMSGVYAGRLWWMLRYIPPRRGPFSTAVGTDGSGVIIPCSGVEHNTPSGFSGAPRLDRLIVLDEVTAQRLLIDSAIQNVFAAKRPGSTLRATSPAQPTTIIHAIGTNSFCSCPMKHCARSLNRCSARYRRKMPCFTAVPASAPVSILRHVTRWIG